MEPEGRQIWHIREPSVWRRTAGPISLISLPILIILVMIIALAMGDWLLAGITFLTWPVIVAFIWQARINRQYRGKQSVEIYPGRQTVILRYATFITGFWPERPRPCAELRFDELLDCRLRHPTVEFSFIQLHVPEGKVHLSDEFEDFGALYHTLMRIVAANGGQPSARTSATSHHGLRDDTRSSRAGLEPVAGIDRPTTPRERRR